MKQQLKTWELGGRWQTDRAGAPSRRRGQGATEERAEPTVVGEHAPQGATKATATTRRVRRREFDTCLPSLLAALGCAVSTLGCDIDTFIPQGFGGPAGAIEGSITYAGPTPCTRDGRIVGAAVLLAFEEKLLPPPEGLGTSPLGLAVVPGEALFRGIRDQLGFASDGSMHCAATGQDVVVSAPFVVAPLGGGVYQVRGFYDRDGNFDPGFSIFNLSSKGDIGGGAIDNATEALLGAPVQYRGVPLGDLQPDGTRVIGEKGVLVQGVSVTLGLPIPLDRPLFHVQEVKDETFGNSDPNKIVVPSDYQLTIFSTSDTVATEASFVRLILGAGVAADEVQAAAGMPFFFPTAEPVLFMSRHDVNGDGVLDGQDHIPETPLVPALLPLGLMTKLEASGIASQAAPSVILQGVTLVDGLLQTAVTPPDYAALHQNVTVALRPAVLCIDRDNPSKDAVLLNTHKTDKAGSTLITDETALEASLSKQFGRPVHVQYGCLPQGRYAINAIYETGQAWTIPNEAGICAPTEPIAADGKSCGLRPILASQAAALEIGPPLDPTYCEKNPTPAQCLK